ncbi:hypothetical protein FOZ63_033134 [Perkinsus olseni]|uniref:Uncharacterized protein n=1 Tax=Perkinsus olseni TaxID=32597 RepID=A0A7J6UI52_PEROL|nr:hypothetical protein FOZ63_033134 [Perkinsus olseni]
MKAAVADANRIRKLAPGLGASVQSAFEAAADVALTAENSIELLEVDSPVSNGNDQSLLGIFTYVGILPSAFESCASNMAGSTFNGDNKNTHVAVENGANEVKVYTEVSAGGDREGSADRMEILITGSLLTSCASPASINTADIPMLESRQAPQPTAAPAKKNPALPWYAWLLIAIGIVLVIAACVYVWWILASRRKQRENRLKLSDEADGDGCCSERGLVPGIAPATGYVDDDADTATVTGIGVDLRVPFIDVGPHGFCDWASGFTKLLMNGSQAYTVAGCSRTGAVLPSSAKALFKESQCTAVYEHLRLKPVGRKSESVCQCENAVRCVGGLLVPKIPKVNPDETVPEMWKRAIAQADWRFRVGQLDLVGLEVIISRLF